MLAENIRKLLKEKGLTHTELGDKLGFRHSAIAGYESGHFCSQKSTAPLLSVKNSTKELDMI